MVSSKSKASNVRELQPKKRERKANDEERVSKEVNLDIETGKKGVSTRDDGRQIVRKPSEITVDGAATATGDMEDPSHSKDFTEGVADVTVITDIDGYAGSTLEEKLESLIELHPVVMFNKTWCLFSVDAIKFLVYQLNVSVHSIEVDVHPKGKEILKYVTVKTGHNTTPLIFIRGEFLGGFSEVNALYAQGTLQDEYLKGLSQADHCEAFINSSNYTTTTYFWFPEKVDAYVVRITGALTCLASATTAALVHFEGFYWVRYIAYGLALDFVLRLLGGARISVVGRIAMLIALPLEPLPRIGKPKQFATCCGVIFSGLGSAFYLAPIPYHDIVGSAFMGGLAVAAGMEGFLDFCVGCVIFRMCVKLGIFNRTS